VAGLTPYTVFYTKIVKIFLKSQYIRQKNAGLSKNTRAPQMIPYVMPKNKI
jgi:hypothetical protein